MLNSTARIPATSREKVQSDHYLNDGYAQEVKVGDASELLKEILGYEIPNGVFGGDHTIVDKLLGDSGIIHRCLSGRIADKNISITLSTTSFPPLKLIFISFF